MKKILFAAAILTIGLVLIGAGNLYAQQQGYGGGPMMDQQGQQGGYYDDYDPGAGWYCPWCGQGQGGYGMRHGGRGMGPGMMRGYHQGQGRGMGYGMMGRGYHGGRHDQYGYGYPRGQRYGYGSPQGQQPQEQGGQNQPYEEYFTKEQATLLVKDYLRSMPNLKVGDVTEKEEFFEAEVVTKKGELVDKIQVDKHSGWFKSAYE